MNPNISRKDRKDRKVLPVPIQPKGPGQKTSGPAAQAARPQPLKCNDFFADFAHQRRGRWYRRLNCTVRVQGATIEVVDGEAFERELEGLRRLVAARDREGAVEQLKVWQLGIRFPSSPLCAPDFSRGKSWRSVDLVRCR